MRLEHKSVTIVANAVVGERCHVFLLDTYISKLPPAAVEKDIFYCKPLSGVPTDPTNPWYLSVPVGRNLLGKMVQDMCSDAGIEGKKTNHSLRVSGASTLFEAGVPERVIQQRTGHRSLLSEEDLENCKKKPVSKNTQRAYQWAFNVVCEWIKLLSVTGNYKEEDLWSTDALKSVTC